jgi:hypothetical protein
MLYSSDGSRTGTWQLNWRSLEQVKGKGKGKVVPLQA